MIGKPKPTKADRPKKSKASKPQRAVLEKQIEATVKMIIAWRDGGRCVQYESDGHRCGGRSLSMWGHYIAQGQSNWLRLDIGNVFIQCANHNLLDHNNDKSYAVWFAETFGLDVAKIMDVIRAEHSGGKKRAIFELEELLAHYDDLYQNRYSVGLSLPELVAAGYYGDIIKNVWANR